MLAADQKGRPVAASISVLWRQFNRCVLCQQ